MRVRRPPSPPAPPDRAVEAAPPSLIERAIDFAAAKVHPRKHVPGDPPGPNIISHERPFFESKTFAFGLEWGVTVSELHQIRAQKSGLELVHVVNPDGSSNLELVLGRRPIGAGQRVELQGPAINTSLSPGQLPLGARLLGVGLTSDIVDAKAHEAASYTFEVKLTERSAAELAQLVAPGAAAEAAKLLSGAAAEGVGKVIVDLFAGAVPIISGAIAISTAYWAFKVCKDRKASFASKALAVTHALFDAVRVPFPLIGTLGNASLVLASAGVAAWKARRAKSAPPTGGQAPPTGPPS